MSHNSLKPSLPPYDVVSLQDGLAYLIELPGCRDLELEVLAPDSFRLSGKKDTRPALATYSGHMHNGRTSGQFSYDFELPAFYEIVDAEASEQGDGIVVVVVRKELHPC